VVLFVVLPGGDDRVVSQHYQLIRQTVGAEPVGDSIAVYGARRTTEVRWPCARVPWPVYADRAAAAAEDDLVDPADETIRLNLRPGRVRVIHGLKSVLLPPAALTGSVTPRPDGLRIDCDRLESADIVVLDDRVWPVTASENRGQRVLLSDDSMLLGNWLMTPPGEAPSPAQRRLLLFWQRVHSRGGIAYLIDFAPPAGESMAAMTVSAIPLPASTTQP
jgi:hypothetical protein